MSKLETGGDFLGHSFRWWANVRSVLDTFEVGDSDQLAFKLRSRGEKNKREQREALEEAIDTILERSTKTGFMRNSVRIVDLEKILEEVLLPS